MVLPWIGHTSSKSRVICPKAKTSNFLCFWVSVRKKNSSGRRSDNIDASGLPNSSSESWRPEDSENVVVFEVLVEVLNRSYGCSKSGDQEKCPLKFVFLGLKFGRKHLFDPFRPYTWLESMVISFHMVFLKKYFVDPTGCQNFGDAPGQIPELIMSLCHKWQTKSCSWLKKYWGGRCTIQAKHSLQGACESVHKE